MRYGDDCLVAGEGGPERAAWVHEALCEQLAEIGLEINYKKSTIGSLHDGFRFLGIFWRVNRETRELELVTPYGRQRDTVQEIRNVMWKTFQEDPLDRLAVVEAVRDALSRRTQYLRRCRADDGEIWSGAHARLVRLAQWYHWPIDRIEEASSRSC
jgi:hypothetical protein